MIDFFRMSAWNSFADSVLLNTLDYNRQPSAIPMHRESHGTKKKKKDVFPMMEDNFITKKIGSLTKLRK